jgi:hypothetical protein
MIMKTFKSVILVKHPKQQVWESIRDRLGIMVPYLDDVAQIHEQERRVTDAGVVELTNIWQADISIPPVLQSVIDHRKLGWTDRAQWFDESGICLWEIEPHFLPGVAQCKGKTRYESAIGGKGTRITFEGELIVDASRLDNLPAFMENTANKTIETLVTTLIPTNFRKVTTALSEVLKQSAEDSLPA